MIELRERLAIATLGRFEARSGDRILPAPPGRGARLLNLLLCAPRHALSSECLAETLWPDSAAGQANLHAAARDLRRWLGFPSTLVFQGDRYALAAGDVDADRFEADVARARTARRLDRAEACRRYQAAISLYEGPFLPEEGSLDWVAARRRHLEECSLEAWLFLATEALDDGLYDEALILAGRVLDLDGIREDAIRIQMRALAGLGRRSEALRLFARLRLTLDRELGCGVDPATDEVREEVARGIVRQAPVLSLV
jgi:DNA-binding SARP family transcriptional activator